MYLLIYLFDYDIELMIGGYLVATQKFFIVRKSAALPFLHSFAISNLEVLDS